MQIDTHTHLHIEITSERKKKNKDNPSDLFMITKAGHLKFSVITIHTHEHQ